MPLPRWVARFNKRVTNRFIQPLVARSAGFAIVHHRGRTSGTSYQTPVNVFGTADGTWIVALTYGPGADWVRNVMAGGGWLERLGTRYSIETAALAGRIEAWPYLPASVRLALRFLGVRDFLRITLVG